MRSLLIANSPPHSRLFVWLVVEAPRTCRSGTMTAINVFLHSEPHSAVTRVQSSVLELCAVTADRQTRLFPTERLFQNDGELPVRTADSVTVINGCIVSRSLSRLQPPTVNISIQTVAAPAPVNLRSFKEVSQPVSVVVVQRERCQQTF